MNTVLQTNYLPTEADIQFFEKNGWFATPIIFTEKEIESLIYGANKFYSGKRDYQLGDDLNIADDSFNNSATLLNNEFTSLQIEEIKNFTFQSKIGSIAAALSRVSCVRYFSDSLITKRPSKPTEKGVIGWHSDKAYWPTCSSNKMLTAWIPLQDVSEDMGPLLHIDESHTWKDDDDLRKFYSFGNQDLSLFQRYLDEKKPDHETSKMILKKGQVSFHNCNVIHSSAPNLSKTDRKALAIHMQDCGNYYKEAYKDNGELITISYDELCRKDNRGLPDYSDDAIFPVMWKK